jgi:catechol 2,3-dioxygenase-like lactoylglutathione lyase family enzyme
MLGDHNIIAFIATGDAERARQFYEDVLGLRCIEDTPFALVFEARGTMLRIQKLSAFKPAPHSVLGWSVPDIEAIIRELRDKGVRFERFAEMAQDELGVWSAPSGAKVAWFKDPDGNILSLTQA